MLAPPLAPSPVASPALSLHALTLITPLRDYQETDSFQLTYKPAAASGAPQSDGYAALGSEDATEGRTAPPSSAPCTARR